MSCDCVSTEPLGSAFTAVVRVGCELLRAVGVRVAAEGAIGLAGGKYSFSEAIGILRCTVQVLLQVEVGFFSDNSCARTSLDRSIAIGP